MIRRLVGQRSRWFSALPLWALLGGGVACSGATTQRVVESPSGSSVEYGAPQNTSFVAEVFPEPDVVHITLYERSDCERIEVETVSRRRETLEGSRVVATTELGKAQRVKGVQGSVPCQQRYSSGAEVFLKVGKGVYPIGTTNARGAISTELSERLKADVYGAPERDVVVLVRAAGAMESREAGRVRAGLFKEHEALVASLSTELSGLLGKEEPTPAEITRSYELYAKLRSIAPQDARFEGLSARFWEVYLGRKRDEGTQRLRKNLKALEEAKGVLSSASLATIPLFAQIAASSGEPDARAVDWAIFEVLGGLRRAPELCTGGLGWGKLGQVSLGDNVRFAASYLRGVHGDDYLVTLQGLCGRVGR